MGRLTVEVYSDKHFRAWDAFVEGSRNGTIFHTRKFLSYHPQERFKDCSLIFLEGRKIVSIMPACLVENGKGPTLVSHQGSTYGGLVIPFKFGIDRAFETVDLLLEFVALQGIGQILMRHAEYIFELEPSEEIKFALWHRGFRTDYLELSTCYDLAIYEGIEPLVWKARKSVEKGVSCVFDSADFRAYYEILSENLASKYNRAPTHSYEEMLRLKELLGEEFVLIGAYHGEDLVGGLVVFLANRQAAHVFYTASRKGYEGIYINDTLVDFAIREFKKRGFRFLNYGVSTWPGERGRKLNLGLFRFKEKFKGFGVCREMWRWTA